MFCDCLQPRLNADDVCLDCNGIAIESTFVLRVDNTVSFYQI